MPSDLYLAGLLALVLPLMVVEELHAHHLREIERRALRVGHYRGLLVDSADRAIDSARRGSGHGGPSVVTVRDVQRLACQTFGLCGVPRAHAAAVLCVRLEQRDPGFEIVSDAETDQRPGFPLTDSW